MPLVGKGKSKVGFDTRLNASGKSGSEPSGENVGFNHTPFQHEATRACLTLLALLLGVFQVLRGDCDARRHSQSPIFNIHEWGDFVNTFLAIPQTITDDCLTSGIFLLCKIEMLVRRNIEVRVLAIVMYVTNHRRGVKGTALVHSYDNKEFNYKKGVALVPHSID